MYTDPKTNKTEVAPQMVYMQQLGGMISATGHGHDAVHEPPPPVPLTYGDTIAEMSQGNAMGPIIMVNSQLKVFNKFKPTIVTCSRCK